MPNIEPLRGALVRDWKTCGNATCRCARGALHGPYYSLRWREDGRQRREYVRTADVEQVQARLQARRARRPPTRALRERLRELRWLLDAAMDASLK